MSFQNPIQYEKTATLSHNFLSRGGPKLVTVKSAPKWVKGNTLCVVQLVVDGNASKYFTENKSIADDFSHHVGRQVVLIGTGDAASGTNNLQIVPAEISAKELNIPEKVIEVVSSKKDNAEDEFFPSPVKKMLPTANDIAAKTRLCQSANMMRLCIKKATDISKELGLSECSQMSIANTLFRDSAGQFMEGMPLQAYSLEELGSGASSDEG